MFSICRRWQVYSVLTSDTVSKLRPCVRFAEITQSDRSRNEVALSICTEFDTFLQEGRTMASYVRKTEEAALVGIHLLRAYTTRGTSTAWLHKILDLTLSCNTRSYVLELFNTYLACLLECTDVVTPSILCDVEQRIHALGLEKNAHTYQNMIALQLQNGTDPTALWEEMERRQLRAPNDAYHSLFQALARCWPSSQVMLDTLSRCLPDSTNIEKKVRWPDAPIQDYKPELTPERLTLWIYWAARDVSFAPSVLPELLDLMYRTISFAATQANSASSIPQKNILSTSDEDRTDSSEKDISFAAKDKVMIKSTEVDVGDSSTGLGEDKRPSTTLFSPLRLGAQNNPDLTGTFPEVNLYEKHTSEVARALSPSVLRHMERQCWRYRDVETFDKIISLLPNTQRRVLAEQRDVVTMVHALFSRGNVERGMRMLEDWSGDVSSRGMAVMHLLGQELCSQARVDSAYYFLETVHRDSIQCKDDTTKTPAVKLGSLNLVILACALQGDELRTFERLEAIEGIFGLNADATSFHCALYACGHHHIKASITLSVVEAMEAKGVAITPQVLDLAVQQLLTYDHMTDALELTLRLMQNYEPPVVLDSYPLMVLIRRLLALGDLHSASRLTLLITKLRPPYGELSAPFLSYVRNRTGNNALDVVLESNAKQ